MKSDSMKPQSWLPESGESVQPVPDPVNKPVAQPVNPTTTDPPNNDPPETNTSAPYKGLRPYTDKDADIFFGRTRDIQRIVNNLLAWRLTVLYGESGVGKSSVLQAGVIHALQAEAQENLEDYGFPKLAVVLFPSQQGEHFWQQDPLQSLMQQIVADMQASGFPIQMPEPGTSLLEMLQTLTAQLGGEHLDGRVFIILDQFEEYFQYHPSPEPEGGLIAEIARVMSSPDLRVNFLISLREDAYAKLNLLRRYLPNILDICLQIEHLDRDAAREAIVLPIEKYNQRVEAEEQVTITPDLVNAILQGIPRVGRGGEGRAGLEKLEAVLGNQILAPYLQLVMMRLWDEMVQEQSYCLSLDRLTRIADPTIADEDEKITIAIDKIVQEHVAETLRNLSIEEQDIAARSFQYLVTPSGTKYAYSTADLANLVGCEAQDLDRLFDQLTKDQRIIRRIGSLPDRPDVERYEIFHDVLAAAILQWRMQYVDKQRKEQERKEQEKREQEQQWKHWKISKNLMMGTFVGTAIIALFGWQTADAYRSKVDLLIKQSQQALQQFNNGQQLEGLQQAIQTGQTVNQRVQKSPFRWLLGDQQNQAIQQSTATLQQMLMRVQVQNQLEIPSGQLTSLDLSADWKIAALAFSDGTIEVREITTGKQLNRFSVTGKIVDLHIDGTDLVVVLDDGKVQRGNWQTGQMQPLPQISQQSPANFRFSAQGSTIALLISNPNLSKPFRVEMWDWKTDRKLTTLPSVKNFLDFALSPDGKTLATATGDSTVQVWNSHTGQPLTKVKTSHQVVSLDLSPDGKTLAVITTDGILQLWNWPTQKPPTQVPEFNSAISLHFSPQGNILAIVSTDGKIQLWDPKKQQSLTQITPIRNSTFLGISPDGQKLAILTDQGTLQLWPLKNRTAIAQFQSKQSVLRLWFSPDGQQAGMDLANGLVQFWNPKANRPIPAPKTLSSGDRDLIISRAISSPQPLSSQGASQTIVTGSVNGTITLWNAQGANETLQQQGDTVLGLSISPDGQTIASGDSSGTITLWNAQGKKLKTLQEQPKPITSLSFSPDGKIFVSGMQSGEVTLWNLSGQKLQTLAGHRDAVTSIRFSPDGQTIATASDDATVRLWNAAGQELATLQGRDAVNSVSFSPNGQQIATLSKDTLQFWDTQGNLQATLPGISSFAFSPNGQQIALATPDGVVSLLPTDLSSLLTQGCQWLQPYLQSHPQAAQDLSYCSQRSSSAM
ncbi:eIF2A-related protein [Alkalinema pantanalense CENA528]|uniref:nSTAND1 domain-containing NTPase n=1 Tax=Alkalinema pantanalense TaxID=1620705 RepID=UPI003D6DD652